MAINVLLDYALTITSVGVLLCVLAAFRRPIPDDRLAAWFWAAFWTLLWLATSMVAFGFAWKTVQLGAGE